MNDYLLKFILLAQENRLEYLTRGFRRRQTRIDFGDVVISLLTVASFLLALWLLSRLIERQQERGPRNSRLGLFFSLCKAHGLPWSEWWLLWRLARHQRLRDPARLFLEPQRFDSPNLGPALQLRADRLKGIAGRLFAGLPENAQRPPESAQPPAEKKNQPLTPPSDDPLLSELPVWARSRPAASPSDTDIAGADDLPTARSS